MNTANLQLEGLLIAVAAINQAPFSKGLNAVAFPARLRLVGKLMEARRRVSLQAMIASWPA